MAVSDVTVTDDIVTERAVVHDLVCPQRNDLFGRKIIRLDYDEITDGNLLEALGKALAIHDMNARDIQYLWDYYRGKQPILSRVKNVRSDICNKIVVNVANEIVSFKVGYQAGEPIMYISRSADEGVMDGIMKLNSYMFAENKASQDQEVVEWQMVCGVANRMVLPDPEGEEDECPFEMYTLDPRRSFVAYSTDLGDRPLMGVKFRRTEKGREYTVYTETDVYTVAGGEIKNREANVWGIIPIFEYPANHARLGAFEIVLPLLDALNNCSSNAMDGIEQQIQAFLKFVNCEIDSDGMNELRELGAIMIKSVQGMNADVDVVNNDLNQDQTQTLKNDLYQHILTICGMPNRNGGTSTSDTGSAVIFRDGWETAESRAKDFEHIFKRSEKKMLRLVLKICKELNGDGLKLSDIDMKFTRRNYENIQSKSQVLVSMLGCAKIHPKLAFAHCGMFSDPESAWEMSEKYYTEEMEKWQVQQVDESGGGDLYEAPQDGRDEA